MLIFYLSCCSRSLEGDTDLKLLIQAERGRAVLLKGLGVMHQFCNHTLKVVGLRHCFSMTDIVIAGRTPRKRAGGPTKRGTEASTESLSCYTAQSAAFLSPYSSWFVRLLDSPAHRFPKHKLYTLPPGKVSPSKVPGKNMGIATILTLWEQRNE